MSYFFISDSTLTTVPARKCSLMLQFKLISSHSILSVCGEQLVTILSVPNPSYTWKPAMVCPSIFSSPGWIIPVPLIFHHRSFFFQPFNHLCDSWQKQQKIFELLNQKWGNASVAFFHIKLKYAGREYVSWGFLDLSILILSYFPSMWVLF